MSEVRGGPPPGQFLQALQQVALSINAQAAALNSVAQAAAPVPASMIQLAEIGVPAAPTAGFVIYVDAADHRLKARGSAGTITTLANP
jgi:hypothetical protein